jgi:hypothetical protein
VLDDAVAAVSALSDASEIADCVHLLLTKRAFFSAIRCVLTSPTQLLAVLADVRLACEAAAAAAPPGTGDNAEALVSCPHGTSWDWPDADRAALCAQFAALPAVRAYTAVRAHLDGCGAFGTRGRCALEAQLLLRAVADFEAQLRPVLSSGAVPAQAMVTWLDAHLVLRAAKAAADADAAAKRAAAKQAQAAAVAAAALSRSASPVKGHKHATSSLAGTLSEVPPRPPLPPATSRPGLPQRVAAQRAAREAAQQAEAAAAAVAALERQKAALEAKLAAEKARAAVALAQVHAEKEALAAQLRKVASVQENASGETVLESTAADDSSAAPPPPSAPAAVSQFMAEHRSRVETKPTSEEVGEYAAWLGMDSPDRDLFYIAEWALTAPLPPGWSAHLDDEGNEYYHSSSLGESTYGHPLDEQYRKYWRTVREQKNAEKEKAAEALQPEDTAEHESSGGDGGSVSATNVEVLVTSLP